MADVATPYIAAQELSRAYTHLRSNRALQLTFPPQATSPVPGWLAALLRLLGTILPALKIILAIAAVLVAVGLVFVLVRRLMQSKKRGKSAGLVLDTTGGVDWRPEARQASILLQDADRLAAESQYAEAVHLLLLRSVQDIQGRHPGLVRPALTSRDIAQLGALSHQTRTAFATMAEVVEASLFGGRPISAEAFGRCRQIYEGFAFPTARAQGNAVS